MKKTLKFEALVRWKDDEAYAASMNFNALFKVDMSTGECSYIRMFNEDVVSKRLFTTAYMIGKKIYFVPARASSVAVYEPEDNNLYELTILPVDKQKYKHYNERAKFNGGVVIGKYLFMIPCTYPGLIRIDSETDEMVYFTGWVSDGDYIFRKMPVSYGSAIYIPSVINNRILRFDTDKCIGKLLKLPTNHGGWWSMCKIGDHFWLSPKKEGPIICWDESKNIVTEYENYPEGFVSSSFNFTVCFEQNGNPVFLPVKHRMGIVVDRITGNLYPWFIKTEDVLSKVTILFNDDQKLYIEIDSNVKQVDKNTLEVADFSFWMSEKNELFYRDFKEKSYGSTIKEDCFFNLSDLLQSI